MDKVTLNQGEDEGVGDLDSSLVLATAECSLLKGKWHVYPAREPGCGCQRAFKWSLANVFCAADGNEIHASSVVTLH